MKKTIVILLSCITFTLQGCSNEGVSSASGSDVSASLNNWHVSLTIEADMIDDLSAFSYSVIYQDGSQALVCGNIDGSLMYNAVLITKGEEQRIYDYDGNLLYTLPVDISESKNGEGIINAYAQISEDNNYVESVFGAMISEDKAIYLSSDFRSATEIEAGRMILHPYDGDQYYDTLSVQNDEIGVLCHEEDDGGYITDRYVFKKLADQKLPDLFIAQETDEDCNIIDEVVCDSTGKILSVVPNEILKRSTGILVNGFYPAYIEKDDKKQIALVDAVEGKEITDYSYSDVGYFSGGYCSVSNDEGKWAYINTAGEEVTDFIFDKASPVYDGKAWVLKDGKAGILNLDEALQEKDHLNESVFAETNSDIVESEKQEQDEVLGTVSVEASSINIRKDAGVDYELNGSVASGEEYDVYEIKENDGYTWYRIGEGKWIAGNDEWVTYSEK